MFGSPFFGAASMIDEGVTFDRPQMIYLGVEYSRQLAKGFSIGVDVDVFHHLSGDMNDADGVKQPMETPRVLRQGFTCVSIRLS